MSESGNVADPKVVTGGSTDPSGNGQGRATGNTATAEANDWFANSEYKQFGDDPQTALAVMKDRLTNRERLSGQLADDLGQTRQQVASEEEIKKSKRAFGKAVKDAILSDDDEALEDVFNNFARLQFDFYDSRESAEADRVKAHDIVIARSPELADIRYGEVVREARLRGVSLDKIAKPADMKRFMSDIKAAKVGKIDIDAERRKARQEGVEEGKRLAQARGSVLPGGSGGNLSIQTDDPRTILDPMERINALAQQGWKGRSNR